jgi:hypothetical protein
MLMLEMTPLHKNFLVACADDWSGPWLLVSDIRVADPKADDPTVKARTLEILRDLLAARYIRAGDLVDFKSDKFVPWNLAVDQIIERIQREWDALKRDPNPWEIVWFDSTAAGDKALAEGQERNVLKEREG